MGASHARAYHKMPEFEIVGLVSRGPASRGALSQELGGLPEFGDYYEALAATAARRGQHQHLSGDTRPLRQAAIEAGCHVFCEKPLAETVDEAQAVVDAARAGRRKLVIGYILRVHPAWTKFIEIARTLGKPLVMRMNLNQQSHGPAWNWHRNLMESMSPIVDCGVHYVDVMCQMTGARPVRVSAIGARLTDDIKPGMYNYGQLQVTFDDGSVGWYEAGWGPMMSEVAFFVKDVVGPKGCVSIVKDPNDATAAGSDDIDSHTKTNCLRVHHSGIDAQNEFVKPDEFISTEDEPDHQASLRSRAGVSAARDPGGSGSVGAHARCGEQPPHRARRRRERPNGPRGEPLIFRFRVTRAAKDNPSRTTRLSHSTAFRAMTSL